MFFFSKTLTKTGSFFEVFFTFFLYKFSFYKKTRRVFYWWQNFTRKGYIFPRESKDKRAAVFSGSGKTLTLWFRKLISVLQNAILFAQFAICFTILLFCYWYYYIFVLSSPNYMKKWIKWDPHFPPRARRFWKFFKII